MSWQFKGKKPPTEILSWREFPLWTTAALVLGTSGLISSVLFTSIWLPTIIFSVLLALPIYSAAMFGYGLYAGNLQGKTNFDAYFDVVDKSFNLFKSQRIPLETLTEAYLDGLVTLKGDLLQTLRARYEFVNYKFTKNHVNFFMFQWIPELLTHSRIQDVTQIRDHYDRGNDFYGGFLGESMIYTSAIFHSPEDSLEKAQFQKLNYICNKLQVKPGDTLLDIGCGWGTLICHAAKYFGARATGVTLSKEQTSFIKERALREGIADKVEVLCMDYRDIPANKYDKITCVEMAEHVGVKNYSFFLQKLRGLLKVDGIMFYQICGLRRAWQLEDLQWGLFMAKYIFPGADASGPISWVLTQLETAGFEVHTVENTGIHYAATLHQWYLNWVENKAPMEAKYGGRLYRLWEWFLAHSTIIAEQGISASYQIIVHHCLSEFDRSKFLGEVTVNPTALADPTGRRSKD